MSAVQAAFLTLGALATLGLANGLKRGRLWAYHLGWIYRNKRPARPGRSYRYSGQEWFAAAVGAYAAFVLMGLLALVSLIVPEALRLLGL
jgi:hypothetical protein